MTTIPLNDLSDSTNNPNNSKWIPINMKLPNNQPTDAYGELEFHAVKKKAKYIRVGNKTKEKDLNHLLIKEWKLDVPPIIISVTGGAKDFKMRSRLTKEFQRSLVKAAESTGAWIVTGGTHTGVMKHVGNAIHSHNTAKNKKITAIGIATWGIISNKELLINKRSVKYKCDNSKSLDQNHTHFILVDDGTKDKFGVEIELRAKLERFIASKNENVRVVCVIVQGGPGSLNTVTNALENETPVVVVGDSGGWANVIAELCKEDFNSVSEEIVSQMAKEQSCKVKDQAQLAKFTNQIRSCIKKKDRITIFNQDQGYDLDYAILNAILSANSTEENQTENHLKLALAWNRADIAQSDILTEKRDIDDEVLCELFVQAIEQDKAAFVKLFLDYGLTLRNAFTNDRLKKMYVNTDFKDIFKDQKDKDISKLKKQFLGRFYQPEHSKDNSNQTVPDSSIENFKENGTQSALRELFFYSILFHKKECAWVIWQALTEDTLPAALVAIRLLTELSKKAKFKDLKDNLEEHSEKYKNLTYGILSECYDKNEDKTMTLLKRRLKHWGNLTCLQIAFDTKDLDLVSHPAIQSFLDQIWLGELINWKQSFFHIIWGSLKIYFAAFTLLLIPCLISFKKISKSDEKGSAADCCFVSMVNGSSQNDDENMKREMKCWQKIPCFYKAPIVKFHLTTLFYVLFLFLFGYILLFNFHGTVSLFEWILVAWIVALLLEELRQVCNNQDKGIQNKLSSYWKSFANRVDILGFILYFVGFGLRFSFYLDVSRGILCSSFAIFCLRLLSLFTVNKELGPKLLMVKQMMKNLFFFIFILLVFLIAYGVVSQSLLYPNETDVGRVFTGIFSNPYWLVYGELFLSEINYNPTTDEYSCTSNSTLIAQGYSPCPTTNRFVPVITAFYLLFANVLLLNLLIAMFTYTFESLVEKNDKIWKFQRFSLIEEYYRRPAFVVPFSFISFIYKPRCCYKSVDSAFAKTLKDEDEKAIKVWQQQIAEEYKVEQNVKEKESINAKVQSVADKVDSIANVIGDLQANLNPRLSIEKRVTKLESKLNSCNQSLEWIISALLNGEIVPKDVPGKVHVTARRTPYYKSNVERVLLKDHMVPWNVPFPDYNPPLHTDQKVLVEPPWADKKRNHSELPYNRFDNEHNVNRKSYMGVYDVVDGLPRNPYGRTGIAGRGLLGRFGPNHAADPIVTRWEKDEKGEDVFIDGKKVLEFVAIQRKDTKEWAIPGGMVNQGETTNNTLRREFLEEVDSLKNLTKEKAKEIKERLELFLSSQGQEVYRGYSDDHRNTDNAWIETVVYNYHDEDGSVFGDLKLSAGNKVEKATWKRVEKKLDLFAEHSKFIGKVAEMHGAYF